MLAPNAKLRTLVMPQGPEKEDLLTEAAFSDGQAEHSQVRPGRISWALLLNRVFQIDLQHCPNFGAGELKISAAILERPVIPKILDHLGLDPQPAPKGHAREPDPHFAA